LLIAAVQGDAEVHGRRGDDDDGRDDGEDDEEQDRLWIDRRASTRAT